ncbi:hypothetical protein [Humibacillus sp. DSM 29435]|uniref:hypothetical protein n=1 Tax=Humibacillus sp. DSM 29435 TaxID=1869167 RepID=UPI001586EB41|nr:hypothetical protein [Humibacillus sp. DSM 29435]
MNDHRMPSGTTVLTGETRDVAEVAGILEHRGLATTPRAAATTAVGHVETHHRSR